MGHFAPADLWPQQAVQADGRPGRHKEPVAKHGPQHPPVPGTLRQQHQQGQQHGARVARQQQSERRAAEKRQRAQGLHKGRQQEGNEIELKDDDDDDFIPDMSEEIYQDSDEDIMSEGFMIDDVPADELGADLGGDFDFDTEEDDE